MAVPWAALVNLGVKGVTAAVKSGERKGIGGASLVDPRQQAMVNLMQRERQALKTGTSQTAARTDAAKQTKRFLRSRALMGGRNIADIADYGSRVEGAITKGVAEERMGLLGPLVEQTENISKRKMDLLELEKERGLLKKEARGQNLDKNITALAGTLGDGGGGKKEGDGGNFDWQKALGTISSMFGGGQGESGGGSGGGGGGNFDWGKAIGTVASMFGGGGGGK
jgi:hypothetical protein